MRRSRGQALAEFALVAPIFFLILLGIIEGGRFMFYYEVLNHATREGARFAIVNGGNSPYCSTGPAAPRTVPCDEAGDLVRERVRNSALGIDPAAIDVEPSWWDNGKPPAPGTNARGQRVHVEASYTYTTLVPIVPLPPITVTAESSLVVNN
jgi:hypothetical protein